MDAVNKQVESHNLTVNQASRRQQIISNVTIRDPPPNYCPKGTHPTGYSTRNQSSLDMGTHEAGPLAARASVFAPFSACRR